MRCNVCGMVRKQWLWSEAGGERRVVVMCGCGRVSGDEPPRGGMMWEVYRRVMWRVRAGEYGVGVIGAAGGDVRRVS